MIRICGVCEISLARRGDCEDVGGDDARAMEDIECRRLRFIDSESDAGVVGCSSIGGSPVLLEAYDLCAAKSNS